MKRPRPMSGWKLADPDTHRLFHPGLLRNLSIEIHVNRRNTLRFFHAPSQRDLLYYQPRSQRWKNRDAQGTAQPEDATMIAVGVLLTLPRYRLPVK